MTNITEVSNFDAAIYEWATTDAALGGPSGPLIIPIQSLTNRTRWLYNALAALSASIAGAAPLNSPVFTGSPTCPEPPIGDNSGLIANTEWVQATVNGLTTINCTGLTTLSLSIAQAASGIIKLTGVMSAALALTFPPTITQSWTVINATSGLIPSGPFEGVPWLVTAGVLGSGVLCGCFQGSSTSLVSDGTTMSVGNNYIVNAFLDGAPIVAAPALNDNSNSIISSGWINALFAATTDGNGTSISFPGGWMLKCVRNIAVESDTSGNAAITVNFPGPAFTNVSTIVGYSYVPDQQAVSSSPGSALCAHEPTTTTQLVNVTTAPSTLIAISGFIFGK